MNRLLLALVVVALTAIPASRADDKDKAKAKNPVVIMKVKYHGTVKIELYEDKAPETVKNFLKYVDDKHFDDTVFHRVIGDFMIQGGHFGKGFAKAKSYQEAEKLGKKSRETIKNEAKNGLSNTRGTLAMARLRQPDTASDQFFINVVDNSGKLDPGKLTPDGYAVFGKVIDGMDVVDKIRKVKTLEEADSGHGDVPVEDVVIESVRREKSK